MAGQSGAEPTRADQAAQTVAARDDLAAEQPATSAAPPAGSNPYDDLLCTICGLTACWQKPKEQ